MIDILSYVNWLIPIMIIIILMLLLLAHEPEEEYFFRKINEYFKKRSVSIYHGKTGKPKVVFTLNSMYHSKKVVFETFERASAIMLGTHFYPSSYKLVRLIVYPRFSLNYYLFVKQRIPFDFSSPAIVKEVKLGITDVDKNFIISTNDKELTEFIFRDALFKKYLNKIFTLKYLVVEKEPVFTITIELRMKPYEAIYGFLAVERAIELMKIVRKPFD